MFASLYAERVILLAAHYTFMQLLKLPRIWAGTPRQRIWEMPDWGTVLRYRQGAAKPAPLDVRLAGEAAPTGMIRLARG